MVSAMLNGIVGTLLVFWLGGRFWGLDLSFAACAVVASNLAGFVALLSTLALERRKLSRRILMGNALKTWLFLALLYGGSIALLIPELRDATRLAILFIPLVMSNGFMLPLFGKAQDALIRWESRRAKKQKSSSETNRVIRIET